MNVLAEAERRNAELAHAETRLAARGGCAEHDRARARVSIPLAERPVAVEQAVERRC